MNLGSEVWDDCPYAIPMDDLPRGKRSAPVPQLTDELARWMAHASVWAARNWHHDRRVLLSLLEAIPLIARFVVADHLLVDGTQFVAISQRQLAQALGSECESKNRARRILNALALKDNPRCSLLLERGERPIIEVIETGVRGRGTSYRLVGIDPVAEQPGHADEPHPSGTASQASGVASPPPGVTSQASGVASPPPGVASPPSGVTSPAAHSGAPTPESDRIGIASLNETAPDGNAIGAAQKTALGTRPPSTHHTSPSPDVSEASIEGRFRDFLEAFGHDAGSKERETFDAFRDRVNEGYAASKLVEGARRYRDSSRPDKWKYPLKFLEDDEALGAFCGRPRAIQPDWDIETAEVARCLDGSTSYLTYTGPTGARVVTDIIAEEDWTATRAREALLENRDRALSFLQKP